MNCLECNTELKDKDQKLKCPKCKEVYLKCCNCEEMEYFENEKGWNCKKCHRWFCTFCFQHSGESVKLESLDSVDEEWICDLCLRKA